jgi:hypothetical protein
MKNKKKKKNLLFNPVMHPWVRDILWVFGGATAIAAVYYVSISLFVLFIGC